MTETTYYEGKSARITSEYAQFGARRFQVADIASVELVPVARGRSINSLAIALAVMAFVFAVLAGFLVPVTEQTLRGIFCMAYALSLVIAILLGAWNQSGSRFVVRLHGAFGTQDVFVSHQRSTAERIVESLRMAKDEMLQQ